MNLPVISPGRWLASYLLSCNATYQSLGIGLIQVYAYPVGDLPASRMPTIVIHPVAVSTTPFGMPDIFEERYIYRLMGYVIDPQPESAHYRTWQFGVATLRLLAHLPHVITASGAPFYTPEHWMPNIDYGQAMIGQTPVHGWSAEVRFHRTVQYAALQVDDELVYPPESFER